MNKPTSLLLALFNLLIFSISRANTVTPQQAALVAGNFYALHFSVSSPGVSLTSTVYSANNEPDYYIFDITVSGQVNSNHASVRQGFVIVSANNAAHPILGYSGSGHFVMPADNNNVAWWLNCRKQEIEAARQLNMNATSEIAGEWNRYSSAANNTPGFKRPFSPQPYVNPLLKSTWNQAPYYNGWCPGGSVTGCVATAMAQIMRYWSYPPHGRGDYFSYWDEQSFGYQNNYGELSENYDTSTYVWSAMPYSIGSTNNQIAKLMYDCGISVDMDYAPGGSGAWVVDGDYPVCAQNSYIKYFGYNPKTVQGLFEFNYPYANWEKLCRNELNNKRVIEYVGLDSINNAGHTWVCDGYDSTGLFHMNWGWGGSDNGSFALNALNVAGYHFDWGNEAVIGIEPPPVSPWFTASPRLGLAPMTVNFNDWSFSDTTIVSYKWLFPGGSPATSTQTNPQVTYSTPGSYTVTEIVTSSTGTDTMVRSNYITVATPANLPISQGFQSPNFPPAGWALDNPNDYNPNGYNYMWQLNTTTGGYCNSSQCMYFNNAYAGNDFDNYIAAWVINPGKPAEDIIGQRFRIYSPVYSFAQVQYPKLTFDVAYAPYNANFTDTLCLYYSLDSGKVWNQFYSKGGQTLNTCGGKTVKTGADTNSKGIFVPLCNNWRTDTAIIPAIAGKTSVMFAFEDRSGNGSPIYIDNINIGGAPLNLNQANGNAGGIKIFPNPCNGHFTLQTDLNTVTGGTAVLEIYNILGQPLYQSPLMNTAGGLKQIDLTAQPSGVYLYRVVDTGGKLLGEGKIIKE